MQAANITKERLASFDRPIKSEPAFKPEQRQGLLTDLSNYLQTLKASSFISFPLYVGDQKKKKNFTCFCQKSPQD